MLALRRAQRAQLEHAASLDGEVRRVTQRIADREQETIVRLSRAADQRDWGDSLHVVRVAGYARIMASRLGLTRDAEESIRRMAPLHDIGKLGIPDHILRKPDRLDEAEFAVVKQHTSIGYRILSGSESDLLSLGADIALTHHERFDGSGYPGGLCGEDIPLAGRIVAVADSFDALTSDRPYKDKWPAELAWLHLRKHSGSWFDPPCVEAFSQGMEEVEEVMTSSADRAVGPGGARTAVSR
jgi:putative two-component system response regulator